MSSAANSLLDQLREAGWRGVPTALDEAGRRACEELRAIGYPIVEFSQYNQPLGLHRRWRFEPRVAA